MLVAMVDSTTRGLNAITSTNNHTTPNVGINSYRCSFVSVFASGVLNHGRRLVSAVGRGEAKKSFEIKEARLLKSHKLAGIFRLDNFLNGWQ